MKIKAMAKVNLGLDVLRRREDGYHEVRMIMQTLDLYDVITLEKNSENVIRLSCSVEGLECDERNLVYKAAKAILDEVNSTQGFDIHIEKNIPIAAGMAGGSTDCAATLVGINRMLELGLSNQRLKEIGVKLGADVPYCVEGGTQLSEGIGEKLTCLKPAPDCYVVVAKPHIGVSTKYVYENLHVETIEKHPDIDGMLSAIENNSLEGVTSKMENILENVTIKKYEVIEQLKNMMLQGGALNSLMSGSGPTVFGIFDDEALALKTLETINNSGKAAIAHVTTFAKETCVEEK